MSSFAVGSVVMQASGSGDCPVRAGVFEAQGDQSAQVQRRGAVMEPLIVVGDAAVADFAVAAGQPGDGAFHHGSVLAVLGLPVRIARDRPRCALERFVHTDGELAPAFGGGALCC